LKSQNSSNKVSSETKSNKLLIILGILVFIILLLLNSARNTIQDNRKLPAVYTSKKELAIRGDIKSADNFKISTSKKIYKATIDTRCLDMNKKDLFTTLFSIYSGIPKYKIEKKLSKSLNKKKGRLVISYNINSRVAKNLKLLSYKLRRLNVFKSIKINGSRIIIGLDINESGEKRVFPYNNTLTPVIGYLKKYESSNSKTKVKGIKGLEKQYNKELNNTQDGILKGERDVLSRISFNKNSTITKRIDGATINLNIPLKLQKNIEIILDHYKKKLGAKEVMAAIMESSTGKIITLASSNRYNPQNIKQSDVDNGYLPVNAIEYQFEPGSVIKPIAISLVIDHNRVSKNELFKAYNKGPKNKKGEYKKGIYKIGRWRIRDDHQFKKKWLTLDDILIYSSNIGTLTLAQRLTGREFYDGFKKFGLSKKTGIDLPYERKGVIHSIAQYQAYENKIPKRDNIFKATDSYGQGITTTFMQVLKAYSTFNNNGKIVTPQIANNIQYDTSKQYQLQKEPIQIIKPSTANEIKRLLIKTVQEGTGTAAKIDNIEIGGKTGTANISNGKEGYSRKKYITSFFGFANDKKHKYTIGVTVREPISRGKYWYYYYASHSAVPVFKELVKTLVELNYLKPTINEK
jgi:cell division protein FtsI (penicillin-binding protein 3)